MFIIFHRKCIQKTFAELDRSRKIELIERDSPREKYDLCLGLTFVYLMYQKENISHHISIVASSPTFTVAHIELKIISCHSHVPFYITHLALHCKMLVYIVEIHAIIYTELNDDFYCRIIISYMNSQ